MTPITPKPPIRCTPCRVRYEGSFYKIQANGEVFHTILVDGEWLVANLPEKEDHARTIRRHASRLRRNRNARNRNADARERNQARRDLGLKQTPYGWE